MKKFVIFILLTASLQLQAQKRIWEAGIMLGASNYTGDINSAIENENHKAGISTWFEDSFDFYNVHFLGGLTARYNFNPRWAVKTSLLFSRLSGDDKHFGNTRNLSFHSNIQELSANVEFNFFDYRTGSLQHRVTPYLFGGIAIFHFNPKTEIYSQKENKEITVNLHDLHTEGQGFYDGRTNYHLWQISVPFGLGMKFSFGRYLCIGLEWGFRKTFTDYIDDISKTYPGRQTMLYGVNENAANASDRTNELEGNTGFYHQQGEMRGNQTNKDWYNFFGITLTSKLNLSKNKCLKK